MSVFFKYVGPVEDVNGMTVRYKSGRKTVEIGPIYHNETQFEVVHKKAIEYFDSHPHYERADGKTEKVIYYNE